MRNMENNHYSYEIYRDPTHAAEFEQDRFGGKFGEYIRRYDEQLICKLLPDDLSGCSILDVGAGTGRLSIPLSGKGAHVTALDASSAMLKIAVQKSRNSKKINIVEGDAHFLPVADFAFDYVVCTRLLMHVIHWKKVISEVCRAARVGVIIDFPTISSFAGTAPLVNGIKEFFDIKVQNYRVFSVADIYYAFEKQNFQVDNMQRVFLLPFFVHRKLDNPKLSENIEAFFRKIRATEYFGSPMLLSAFRKNKSDKL